MPSGGERDRRRLMLLQLVGGPAVLGSYVWSFIYRPEETAQMWGGVPEALRSVYTGWMFVAAASYFGFGYLFLLRAKPDETRVLGRPYSLLLWFYALVLIPSALWMPGTAWMLRGPSLLRFWLVRLDLFAVAAGSIGLILAAITLTPRPSPGVRGLAIVASVAFAVQTVVLDALIWPALFPLP